MDNFDLQKYLASGKIHADTKILTEDLGVELPKVTSQKANAKITNAKQFAEFILDTWKTISDEENESVTGIQNLKIAKEKLETVAKMKDEPVSEDARTDAEEEGYKDGMKDEKEDMKEDARTDAEEEGYLDGMRDEKEDMKEAEDVEVEDDENIDVDIEKDVEVDDESSEVDVDIKASMPGESEDVEEVQALLMKAQEAAQAFGDEKLTDQIGNTITYFTRSHVAGNVSEMDLDIDGASDAASPEMEAELGLEEAKENLNESVVFPMWNKIK